jgi:Uncharacterised nucleotidyltransferase
MSHATGSNKRESRGRLVAGVLAGVWRERAAATDFSEADLSVVAPLLYESGGAGLLWWRLRESPLATSSMGRQLHEAYRLLRLAARVHEREIEYIFSLLRSAGIEPVLVKGWAIGRFYPDLALRPYGDIDLCVRPDQLAKAERALRSLESIEGHYVDLHSGFAKLTSEKWDELFERSQLVSLKDEKIRVLSDEDHLRVLCLHLLRSGAWRPLWLCDVAVALESRAANFDWDRCLGRDRRIADWVACTIGLARQLLGAEREAGSGKREVASGKRKAGSGKREAASREVSRFPLPPALPRWLVPAVLRQWGRCANPHAAAMALPALLDQFNRPRELLRELHERWDQPVRATVALRGRFNNWPRWPYQLGELILRSPELPKQLAMISRERRKRTALEHFSVGAAIRS